MTLRKLGTTVLAWGVALLLAFPLLWMVATSLKTEGDAIMPQLAWTHLTLESYAEVLTHSDYGDFMLNSLFVSLLSTAVALLLAVPAAYAMAFRTTRRTRPLLLWMLSTKMMPAVGALMPIYLLFRAAHLIDTRLALVLVNVLGMLPLAVWMLFSFFKDIPVGILEAGRMDGTTLSQEIRLLLLPLAMPGISSTALLLVILCWNESFWSLNLTATQAATLATFIASFSSPEGLFFAKLSAASTLAVVPILIFGLLGQRQLVRGLTFGAVK
jgi:sorbitol/mannitol transport system permease protein